MNTENTLEWDIDVSILNNRFVMGELMKVLGIAAGITAAIVLLISLPAILEGTISSNSSNARGMKYALILLGITFLLTALFIFAYYGNKYSLSYTIDSKGVSTLTREDQKSRNNKLNFLIVIIAILARSPSAAGAGFLASSHQNQDVKWKKIKKAKFYPDKNTIALSAGYGEKSIVFCKVENYSRVAELARSNCPDTCKIIEK
ncbi:hypothetical protein [Methanolobus profundi]|uniref:Uncharacterized protein n=1 Tax=Methanolobus profundi TaxID=487685 RepID=A0A1I4QTP9_9EURY|nr:hypothetical protein [Methanolobus profundi]SFM43444.1 hypothetical protein SAMN04488696_1194 [Methanolobus profundi]